MKKWITILLAAAVFLTTAGFGQKAEKAPASEPEKSSDTTSRSESALLPETVPETAPEDGSPRILIAYFTWADNTVVEDPTSAFPRRSKR